MTNLKGSVFLALFWSGMTLLFDGFMFFPAARQLRATQFPSTQGTIRSSEFAESEDSEGTTYGAAIQYAYSVGGRDYTGDRYRYDGWKNSSSCVAREIVNSHPAGAKVPVFYNPADPNDAVLSTRIHGNDLFLLTFMTPFNVVALFLWWTWGTRFRRQRHMPVAGGVKIFNDRQGARARLTGFSAVGSALTAVAGTAFISIFMIAAPYGGNPPMQLMMMVWGIILGCGIIAGVWQAWAIRGGKYDLLINESWGRLELPLTQGRKTRRLVPFKLVRDVQILTIKKPSSEDETPTVMYAVMLRINDEEPISECLVEWSDEEKAREFARWLRERLPCNSSTRRPLAGRF